MDEEKYENERNVHCVIQVYLKNKVITYMLKSTLLQVYFSCN